MSPQASDLLKGRIRTLWLEGKSNSEIAVLVNEEFGLTKTRNAVIGLVHRMGLRKEKVARSTNYARSPSPAERRKVPTTKLAVAKAVPFLAPVALEVVKIERPAAPGTEPACGGTPLIGPGTRSLSFDRCRWPIAGQGSALLVCGGSVREGKPYCADHCLIAYQPVDKRQPRRAA